MSSRMGGLVGEGEGSWFNFDIKLILRNRLEVRENTRKIDKQCKIWCFIKDMGGGGG